MTCEVAVMNKLGIALAADSAVTVGNGRKIYNRADKLFPLSAVAPVGIMIYGQADLMGVPWEVIIKVYGEKFGSRRFRRLEDYSSSFLRFVEGSSLLFPPSHQRHCFQSEVRSFLGDAFGRRAKHESKDGAKGAVRDLEEAVAKRLAEFRAKPAIKEFGARFGERVTATYEPELRVVEKELFHPMTLSRRARQRLREAVGQLYAKQWDPSEPLPHYSGVVIAGMGEADPFPILEQYHVGGITAGKLRAVKVDEARVCHEDSAIIVPLAQTAMMDSFCEGLNRSLGKKIVDLVPQVLGRMKHQPTEPELRRIKKSFVAGMWKEIQDHHVGPLMSAVDALPRHDLPRIAETLVSLTALGKRLSTDEDESVGGPIDVALLAKGEGFVWIKRKGAEIDRGQAAAVPADW